MPGLACDEIGFFSCSTERFYCSFESISHTQQCTQCFFRDSRALLKSGYLLSHVHALIDWSITPAYYGNTWFVRTSKCDILSSNWSLAYIVRSEDIQGNVAIRSHGCMAHFRLVLIYVTCTIHFTHARASTRIMFCWMLKLMCTRACTCTLRDETEK